MNTIHIAFALIAVLVVGMAVLALRVRELTRELTTKGGLIPSAIEMAVKHEATMRKILADRLDDSIKDLRKKADEALSRLGIDPETGMAYVGQAPIDVRSPRTKAQLAIERGDVAGAIDELVSVLPQGVSDRFSGWTIFPDPDAQRDAADMVVDAVLNDIKHNGPIARAMKQATT